MNRDAAPVPQLPDIELALTHLGAAGAAAEEGMGASGWEAGENPNPAWWSYRNALKNIDQAKRDFEEARRRAR